MTFSAPSKMKILNINAMTLEFKGWGIFVTNISSG